MSKEIKLTMILSFCLIAIVSTGFQKTMAEPIILRAGHADLLTFSSIEDLCTASELIVIGKVVKVNPAVPITVAEDYDGTPISIVFTVSDIKVEKVIKGEVKPDEIIQVRQDGGTYKGDYYPSEWPELFSKDLRGFFFLKYFSDIPACLSPTQGFLKLVDGKIELLEYPKGVGPIEPEIKEPGYFREYEYHIFDSGMAENDLLNLLEQNLSN